MAWSRSRRRNPPRASWSLSPAQGCRTQRLGLGSPGISSYCAGGGGAGCWAGGQWKGEPRRGPGRPSRAGGSLPLRAPGSRPGYMVRQPLAPMGTRAAAAGGGQAPLPMGGWQGEGPRRRLRRLWAPCVRLCVCVCVLTAALAGCTRCQVVLEVGGALKGHWSPRASGRTQLGLLGRGKEARTPWRGRAPSVDTPRDRHTPTCSTHRHTHTDTPSTPIQPDT